MCMSLVRTLGPCVVRPKISSAALTSLSITGPKVLTRYVPTSRKFSLPDEFPYQRDLHSMHSSNYWILPPCRFSKLFKQANHVALQEPRVIPPSCHYKVASHCPCRFTLFQGAAPMWPCVLCDVPFPQAVSLCRS